MFSRNLFSGASSKKDHRFDGKSQVKEIHFSKKVTETLLIDKINSSSFSQWVSDEISKLTNEDFAADLVMGFLDNNTINSQELGQQLRSMIGEEKAITFVENIWPLLIEAQNNDIGIPSVIIEETQKRIEQTMKRNQLLKIKLEELNNENNSSSYNSNIESNKSDDGSDVHEPPPANSLKTHDYYSSSSDDYTKRASKHSHPRKKHVSRQHRKQCYYSYSSSYSTSSSD